MPELKVYALDEDLAGREPEWIAALTDAVVAVYGDWARELVTVRLLGLPAVRWGLAGRPTDQPAPVVEFGIREAAFDRPDAKDLTARLARSVTAATTTLVGESRGARTHLELIGTPAGRTAVGGAFVD